jgi:hypothetical protein
MPLVLHLLDYEQIKSRTLSQEIKECRFFSYGAKPVTLNTCRPFDKKTCMSLKAKA